MIVFVSHSSEDKEFINVIGKNVKKMGVKFYLAGQSMEGIPLPKKIKEKINASNIIVAIITSTVMNNQTTRDNVMFETGLAFGLNRKIFAFVENGAEVPMMYEQITDYVKFESLDEKVAKERANHLYKSESLKKLKKLKGDKNKILAIQYIIGTILDIECLKDLF